MILPTKAIALMLTQTGNDPTQFIKKKCSFFCTTTYPEEIINIVRKANSKKSSGFDNVNPYIIKKVIPQITNQLANIFNNSILTGIEHRKLKIAKAIPLHNSENTKLLSNYRSILSFHAIIKYWNALICTCLWILYPIKDDNNNNR